MRLLTETFTIKKIPTVVWSSEDSFDLKPKPLTFIFLVFGLFLFGLGEVMYKGKKVKTKEALQKEKKSSKSRVSPGNGISFK